MTDDAADIHIRVEGHVGRITLTRPQALNALTTGMIAAIDAAGLSETLEGEGPFTVLAPTDAAFDEALVTRAWVAPWKLLSAR